MQPMVERLGQKLSSSSTLRCTCIVHSRSERSCCPIVEELKCWASACLDSKLGTLGQNEDMLEKWYLSSGGELSDPGGAGGSGWRQEWPGPPCWGATWWPGSSPQEWRMGQNSTGQNSCHICTPDWTLCGGSGPASLLCTLIGCFSGEKSASHKPPAPRQVSLHAKFNPWPWWTSALLSRWSVKIKQKHCFSPPSDTLCSNQLLISSYLSREAALVSWFCFSLATAPCPHLGPGERSSRPCPSPPHELHLWCVCAATGSLTVYISKNLEHESIFMLKINHVAICTSHLIQFLRK